MAIDLKLNEELSTKKVELEADIKVHTTIYEFAKANADRCHSWRIFAEGKMWMNIVTETTSKLQDLAIEHDKLIKEMKAKGLA